jgi:hypothetical protein
LSFAIDDNQESVLSASPVQHEVLVAMKFAMITNQTKVESSSVQWLWEAVSRRWMGTVFAAAPETTTGSVTFAFVGDLDRFEHLQETLEHMRDHSEGMTAVTLEGNVACADCGHRHWGAFSLSQW